MLNWNEIKNEYLAAREKSFILRIKKDEKEHIFWNVPRNDPDGSEKAAREYGDADAALGEHYLVKRVLRNNLDVVFFNEIIPQIATIWNKYAGKQYGEKTKEKIRKEINDALPGVDVYALIQYYPKIYIDFARFIDSELSPYSDLQLSFTRYDNGNERFLTENNTIEEMQLVTRKKYIEDVPGYIAEMKTLYQEIVDKAAELEKLGKMFNEQAIYGIKSVDYPKFFIPKNIETY